VTSVAPEHSLAIGVVCFPSLGGSGIVATELAVGLAQRGHRVHVIASSQPSRALPESARLFLHEVAAPSYPLFDQAPYTLALASTIVGVAEEHALDVLHVHYAVPHAASAYLATQTLGAHAPRLVTTLHGTDVTRIGIDPSYRAVTRFCVEASDAITVPSAFLQAEAHRLLGLDAGTPIEVIGNFVDSDHFAPPATRDRASLDALFDAARAVDTAGPVLVHVSNFRPVKRVRDLIEVLSRVRRSVPARLLLIGDGPDRNAAAERARELGVQHSVCFLGKRADFVEQLRHADAFLLTSESESFGLAALEALSAGVPVIGYRVGGVPEVVTPDVGTLVAPFDVDAMAARVVELLSNAATRQAQSLAARARVLANFRRAPSLDRYEALFRRVLGTGRSRRT
jgi:N-acetyl-alpha-D-glucosaminyl L-malate synthase BshA